MKKDYLLSIVSDQESQVVVYGDLSGIRYLIKKLKRIEQSLEDDECSHEHLMTESWGGDELTETKIKNQENEKEQVHHLKIYGWNNEWKNKHEL